MFPLQLGFRIFIFGGYSVIGKMPNVGTKDIRAI